ncbi:ABC transporter permease [Kineococcus sp. SYSU DK005]|uniref:ABC transporter permease n=1 Tax=Kineococcus sp. SYSU DK005 TaxID=3383126 RepID=UPI003D7CDA4D
MSTTTTAPTAPTAPTASTAPAPALDNRLGYLGFAAAYALGHGAAALGAGPGAPLDLPANLPPVLLAAGLAVGTVASTVTAVRAQRGAPAEQARADRLLSLTWPAGFAGLFLLIGAVTRSTADPDVQPLLWAAGSALVVGLIYLAEGALRRDTVHHRLGAVLALLAGAGLLLPLDGARTLLATAGAGSYLLAAALVHARLRRGAPR